MANLIDGKKISQEIKDELKAKVAELKSEGTVCSLAVIQVGNDPASSVYVNNKKKACEVCGIRTGERYVYPEFSAFAGLRIHIDLASVSLDYLGHYGKSEARALSGFFRGIERVEYA